MSRPTSKRAQASLDSFLNSASPASSSSVPSSNQQARANIKPTPTNFPHSAFIGTRETSRESAPSNVAIPSLLTAASQQSFTSSLSLPSSSQVDPYEIPVSSPKPAASSSRASRVIKSSDDEEDSDSSLEDLATILQSNRPKGFSPSTPEALRTKSLAFHVSPMPLLKKKFDLKSLASYAEQDRQTDASSKRVKAMQEASNKKEDVSPKGSAASEKLKHNNLLREVVADQGDADISKVARAVARTEATLSEQRWYFFDTKSSPSKRQQTPFPTKSISKDWLGDLKDAQSRNQTFVSGFAEDMISLGKALPDEIFLWLLDATCSESSEILRLSYRNVITQSSEQVSRLIVPSVIRNMFEIIGATSATTAITEKIRPVQALSISYAERDWSMLRTLVELLGSISRTLQERTYALTLLLRMCCDRLVIESIDVFDSVQVAIYQLCKYVPNDSWESSCQVICTTLFNSVEQPTLRLLMVQCMPSTSARTHDLKRRLAMSFYFDDLSYSTQHSHLVVDLEKFIDRLEDSDFDTDTQTDYRELAARILLLNFALDDGRSTDMDLKDDEIANQYDGSIDELAGIIKGIMTSIGNPGAAFISRIEAKEVLELVSQRISDTLRRKPKKKLTVFDRKHGKKTEESLKSEKKFMSSFFKT